MKRSTRLMGALSVVVAAGAAGPLTACSGTPSTSPPPPSNPSLGSLPVAGPDVDPPPNIMLQPDVVIVHGGASVLKNISEDHGVWTLDKSVGGVSTLTPGKVLLIAGLDCARVTAIQDNGATLDVTVEPVAVTDVIQEGSLSWQNLAVDTSQMFLGRVPYDTVTANEAQPDAGADASGGVHAQNNPPTRNPTENVKMTIGNWTISFGATRSTTGADINGTLTWQPGSSGASKPGGDPSSTLGAVNANVVFTSHVTNLSGSSGSLDVSGGSIRSGGLTSPVEGSADFTVDVSTPKGSQFPAQALLKLPIAAEFPVPGIVPGIPFYLSVQAAILIQPSLATAGASLGVTSHIDYKGSAGLTYSNGTATPSSSPSPTTPDNVLNGVNAPPAIGATALVFAIQAPRIGFGIGTMAFAAGAKAGVYVDVVNSVGLVMAPVTSLVPCQEATWDFASHGGGEMNISIGGTTVGVSHEIDLLSNPVVSWYTPMVSACKP